MTKPSAALKRLETIATQVVSDPSTDVGSHNFPQAMSHPARLKLVSASISANEKNCVDFVFEDGAAYRFHALWLRDACRDERYVKVKAGERILGKASIVIGTDLDISVQDAIVKDVGSLVEIVWDSSESGIFPAELLRAYAKTSAKVITATDYKASPDELSWLRPFLGIPGFVGPTASSLNLWTTHSGPKFKEFDWSHVMEPNGNLELIQTLLVDGVAKVTGAPSSGEAILHKFADHCVGGLQKDPSRKEANWKIQKKTAAASVSYNPDLRLNNHTDQSLPNHGIPGLLLMMHYAGGAGQNTLADGVAVAEALRLRDPESFELLCKYGNDQERDLLASRQDAAQNHTRSLKLTSNKPIFQLDSDGNVIRVQYNEVFRMPATIPHEVFPKWYTAYMKFAEMIHSSEFERSVKMRSPDFLIINNWRILHGRDGNRDGTPSGLQTADRLLTGGTVTRETVASRARELIEQTTGVQLYGSLLL